MEHLLKISLAASIIGIFLLTLLADILPRPLTNLEEMDSNMINQKVRVQGEIFKIEDKEGFQILSIKDETGKIDVICNSNITAIQNVEVEGTVKEYKSYLQIQADKIIKNKK